MQRVRARRRTRDIARCARRVGGHAPRATRQPGRDRRCTPRPRDRKTRFEKFQAEAREKRARDWACPASRAARRRFRRAASLENVLVATAALPALGAGPNTRWLGLGLAGAIHGDAYRDHPIYFLSKSPSFSSERTRTESTDCRFPAQNESGEWVGTASALPPNAHDAQHTGASIGCRRTRETKTTHGASPCSHPYSALLTPGSALRLEPPNRICAQMEMLPSSEPLTSIPFPRPLPRHPAPFPDAPPPSPPPAPFPPTLPPSPAAVRHGPPSSEPLTSFPASRPLPRLPAPFPASPPSPPLLLAPPPPFPPPRPLPRHPAPPPVRAPAPTTDCAALGLARARLPPLLWRWLEHRAPRGYSARSAVKAN